MTAGSCPQPRAHDLAVMPRRVVPDQQQRAFALGLGLLGAPGQEIDGHRADGAPIHKAQPHRLTAVLRVCPATRQEAVAGQRLGIRIIARDRLFDQADRVGVVLPGVQGGQASRLPQTPSSKPKSQSGCPWASRISRSCPAFFRTSSGSGLVIHALARHQRTPMRAKMARTVSPLTRQAVKPRSRATSAARSSVRLCPHPAGYDATDHAAPPRWRYQNYRIEPYGGVPCCKTARPCMVKIWSTSRTACPLKPTHGAIALTRSPWALARMIWARRRTKASGERKAASRTSHSASVGARTKRGFVVLIPYQ